MGKDPSIGSGCWYLSAIYINPADKRVVVRKRNNLGWTLNFARPTAIPVLVLMIAYVLAPFYLLDHFGVESIGVRIAAFVGMFMGLMAFCSWMAKPPK
jgi:hypothetical protein